MKPKMLRHGYEPPAPIAWVLPFAWAAMTSGVMGAEPNAMETRAQSASTALMALPPAGSAEFGQDSRYRWLSYCPDNTCEVVRVGTNVPKDELVFIAIAYFTVDSDYIYLKEWRTAPVPMKWARRLSRENPGQSMGISCPVKAHVLFVRFDEHHVSRKRLDLRRVTEAICPGSEASSFGPHEDDRFGRHTALHLRGVACDGSG